MVCQSQSHNENIQLTKPTALLSASITSKAAPVMTLAVENVGVNAAVASTTTSSTSSAKATATTAAKGNGKGNANAKGNGNGNGNGNGRNNNNKARGSSLKWASRLFAADSWEEPSN